ncbi:hypothetical protein CsatB_005262 [Cannabis sativa]
MARGLIIQVHYCCVIFVLIITLLIVLSFIVVSPIEGRPLKKSTTTSMSMSDVNVSRLGAINEDQPHELIIIQTLKWANQSGPSPGEGH